MSSAFDYREMARECVAEAATCRDPERAKALLDIAKLYNETALAMEAAEIEPLLAREPSRNRDIEHPLAWEMDREAMAIVQRHRPDLQGKTMEEMRSIVDVDYFPKQSSGEQR